MAKFLINLHETYTICYMCTMGTVYSQKQWCYFKGSSVSFKSKNNKYLPYHLQNIYMTYTFQLCLLEDVILNEIMLSVNLKFMMFVNFDKLIHVPLIINKSVYALVICNHEHLSTPGNSRDFDFSFFNHLL